MTAEVIGYARVSTEDQNLDLQRDALGRAGCGRIYEDRASGARADRPGLALALAELRAGGEKHGRKRIARLMREAGLVGASRRRGGGRGRPRLLIGRDPRPAVDMGAKPAIPAKCTEGVGALRGLHLRAL